MIMTDSVCKRFTISQFQLRAIKRVMASHFAEKFSYYASSVSSDFTALYKCSAIVDVVNNRPNNIIIIFII